MSQNIFIMLSLSKELSGRFDESVTVFHISTDSMSTLHRGTVGGENAPTNVVMHQQNEEKKTLS